MYYMVMELIEGKLLSDLIDRGPMKPKAVVDIAIQVVNADFLGLRNLTVIRNALAAIEKNHGVKVDFAKMGYDDSSVYEMIASGNTEGIFQLESGGKIGRAHV